MGSLRGFAGRHAGVVFAVLLSPAFVGLEPRRLARPRVVLPEHEAHIVAFSPDSRVILTDGASGGCIRDAATGRVLARLMRNGPDGPVPATGMTEPRFTADGRHVIVQLGGPRFGGGPTFGSELTVTLAVFDVATGRDRGSFSGVGSGIWYGSALPPAEYALSADGSTLAFCRVTGFGSKRTGKVTVWDISGENVVTEFPGLPPLALTPDGNAVAHGDNDDARSRSSFPAIRTVRPGRAAGRRMSGLATCAGLGAGPAAFSPDGKLLAARVSGEYQVFNAEVRDVTDGRVRAVLEPDVPRTNAWISPENLWFSPDGRMLLVEDIGGYTDSPRMQCWDLSGATPRLVLQGPAEGFTPDGSRAAIAEWDVSSRWIPGARDNSTVDVYDRTVPEARLHLVETEVHKATISPDGRTLALPSDRKERIERNAIDALLNKIRGALGLPIGAAALYGLLNPPTIDVHEIRFRDAATGEFVGSIDYSARPGPPYSVTFSPDSQTLVVSYLPADFKGWSSSNPMINWNVELWDIPAGRQIRGAYAWAAALAASCLVLAGAGLDRWRGRRQRSPDESRESPEVGRGAP
jgi:WD40 repeat protein